MENNNVKFYVINTNVEYDANKFKYSLIDMEMENISERIKDESIKDAIILKPNEYKEKYDNEKQQLLYDLSLLENISDIKQ